MIITASRSIDKYLRAKLAQKEELDIEEYPFDIVCVRRGVDIRTYPYRHHASAYWLHSIFVEHPELEHKNGCYSPRLSVQNTDKNG